MSAPLHSNPRLGQGNVEDGNQAKNHQRMVDLRRKPHREQRGKAQAATWG